ncbi:hypothetical protein [Vibrio vulnificus]|uniref:hypothetical protein n=1 Tax=Vibrio vulnificus TaxID=672 RepID=UPI001F50585B|nr:hypothetical protein [Vibrio vulnificus]
MRQKTSTAPLSHQHSAHRHAPPSFPCTRETIQPHAPDATFENTLTAIDNIEHRNSNTGSKAVTPNHNTRYTMGPRIREDDEIRKEKAELSSAAKNKKRCTPPHHQSSFPCTRETIYPHAQDAAF